MILSACAPWHVHTHTHKHITHRGMHTHTCHTHRCMRTHTHTNTLHTHAHTYTQMHARTHTHTHTHTQTQTHTHSLTHIQRHKPKTNQSRHQQDLSPAVQRTWRWTCRSAGRCGTTERPVLGTTVPHTADGPHPTPSQRSSAMGSTRQGRLHDKWDRQHSGWLLLLSALSTVQVFSRIVPDIQFVNCR